MNRLSNSNSIWTDRFFFGSSDLFISSDLPCWASARLDGSAFFICSVFLLLSSLSILSFAFTLVSAHSALWLFHASQSLYHTGSLSGSAPSTSVCQLRRWVDLVPGSTISICWHWFSSGLFVAVAHRSLVCLMVRAFSFSGSWV